jgi:hypothetical protein
MSVSVGAGQGGDGAVSEQSVRPDCKTGTAPEARIQGLLLPCQAPGCSKKQI